MILSQNLLSIWLLLRWKDLNIYTAQGGWSANAEIAAIMIGMYGWYA